MKEQNINEDLMQAVSEHNAKAVKDCLETGADPNYCVHFADEGPNTFNQPKTPLQLVMFCISDSLLEERDLKEFADIATLLLHFGADPKPAMQIAESRYGKYDPDMEKGPFTDVWHIVADAYRHFS